ncbi:CAF17-like 4Fe-4S cluster assembly/insertion protein YgfZ [Jannaschia formosa]|uniref:CAF17-like 4Fe-4S cluster assembly/insertion protein YgfZ n=1 Tax=Jannaschia formosa TaxID=2259592 RepID=UPI000E1BF783|nr:folate-binding protein YgfZ [Jannaschia formosa]TFL18749.1 folate-binding protein [Jannaschia formosa]
MTRTLLRVSGADRTKFLHGLLTRDVPEEGLGYAALLSPQGKYLADFLTFREDDAIYLDVASDLAEATAKRLSMYRLRAAVTIEPTDRPVAMGTGEPPEGALPDPRPGMGWRHYGGAASDDTDWDAVRVEHLIPETGIELIPNESYILEMGFERLGGVDFRKGCYVGQEVTARMKHKTELRKGLARIKGAVAPGEITSDGRPAGTVHTISGDRALAYLRFDRAEGMETAAGAVELDASSR